MTTQTYDIYCAGEWDDDGDPIGWTTEGYWGGELAADIPMPDARDLCVHLSTAYPQVSWAYCAHGEPPTRISITVVHLGQGDEEED